MNEDGDDDDNDNDNNQVLSGTNSMQTEKCKIPPSLDKVPLIFAFFLMNYQMLHQSIDYTVNTFYTCCEYDCENTHQHKCYCPQWDCRHVWVKLKMYTHTQPHAHMCMRKHTHTLSHTHTH